MQLVLLHASGGLGTLLFLEWRLLRLSCRTPSIATTCNFLYELPRDFHRGSTWSSHTPTIATAFTPTIATVCRCSNRLLNSSGSLGGWCCIRCHCSNECLPQSECLVLVSMGVERGWWRQRLSPCRSHALSWLLRLSSTR